MIDNLIEAARRHSAACASTARTPPNSPARHAAARLENERWRELEAALRAAVAERDAQRAAPDADGARFRWLCEDHSDRETREQCRSLIDRLSGMSYSAAVMSIDAAMAAAQEHKA